MRRVVARLLLVRLHMLGILRHLERVVAGYRLFTGDHGVDPPERKAAMARGNPGQVGRRLDQFGGQFAVALAFRPVAGDAIKRVVLRGFGNNFFLRGGDRLNA